MSSSSDEEQIETQNDICVENAQPLNQTQDNPIYFRVNNASPDVDGNRRTTSTTHSLRTSNNDDDADEAVLHEKETLIPTPPLINRNPVAMSADEEPDDVHGAECSEGTRPEVPVKIQEFSAVDYGLCAFSTFLFLFDMSINGYVAQTFQQLRLSGEAGYEIYFWITFVIIILCSVMTAVFEIIWYADEKSKYGHSLKWDQWIVRLIFILMGVGPAFRYVELIIYAFKHTRKGENNNERMKAVQNAMMMKEDADFLYMLEKFTESGLHLVLQVYIAKTAWEGGGGLTGTGEIMKITIAAIIMPYSVMCFLRSERQAEASVNNMTNFGAVIQFISRFILINCQVLVMSLFLTSYPFIFMIITISTWGAMAIWVFTQSTHFSRHIWLECAYRFLIAFIYLFNYVNVRTDPSYYRALFYYSFMFIERGLMICFWAQQEPYEDFFRWPMLVVFFVGFIGGVAIKVIYYECHHPTRKASHLRKSLVLKMFKKESKKYTTEDNSSSA